MTPTEDALVANVAAAPDDDAPRLVYADWLSEQGDPRGELVAVQCALAKADRDDESPAITLPLRDRETALLAQHRDDWFEPLIEISVGTYLFRRGFVERHDLLSPSIDGAALHAAAPLLRAIRTSHAARVREYANDIPIRELTLYELTDVATARRTLEHPALQELRVLELLFRNTEAELARERIAKHLSLASYALRAPVLRAADPPLLLDEVLPVDRAALQSLKLGKLRLDDLRPLGRLPALATLELHGCQLSVEHLATVKLPVLTSLAITERALSTHELGALLDAFPTLRRLRLAATGLENAHASILAAHRHGTSLRRLDLAGNRIELAGTRAIETSPHLQQLVALDFTNNPHDPKSDARIRRALSQRLGE